MVEITVRLSRKLDSVLTDIIREEGIELLEVVTKAIQIYAILDAYAEQKKILVALDPLAWRIKGEIYAPEDTQESFDFRTIKLRISQTVYEGMRSRAEKSGIAEADIVRKGLRIYQKIRELQSQGNNIGWIEVRSRAVLEMRGIAKDLRQ